MIWKQKFDLDDLNSGRKGTILEHLDIRFVNFGENYLEATMPIDHRTIQPARILHGGASVVLAETLGSMAAELCRPNPDQLVVGIEINANHLKMATSGYLTGRVTPIKLGRKMMVWNIEMHNDQKQLICISRLTTLLVDKKST